ncbi:DUF5989 family protein [Aquisphaera insulae]|uniref:DUF5989 family protein n=1 Tax=Aquisphaera insulae TaxID=2712864 RepID=UPI0013EC4825|nr:DUF5989 family protein [Aquisphaera insulae]
MSQTTDKPVNETEKAAASEFEKLAAAQQSESLVSEFLAFLAENKKWWLLPIVVVMLLLGVLIFLSSTAAAPFIYTLF